MSLIRDIRKDLDAAHKFGLSNKIALFFFNRGIHALLFYRIAHALAKIGIPLIPFLLTRFIQIIYAIDIDFRSKLDGGIVIVHGVGLVIGQDVCIAGNTILFHGVTLGRRGIGPVISETDGFPVVESDCIICAGAKLLGKINIGQGSVIGANCVVSKNIAPKSICKLPSDLNVIYSQNTTQN